jgi:hypothetical protein
MTFLEPGGLSGILELNFMTFLKLWYVERSTIIRDLETMNLTSPVHGGVVRLPV